MSALIDTRTLHVAESSSPLTFERAGPQGNPDFDRYLLLRGKRAYHVGNRCDTCAFFFERLDGANEKVSPSEIGELLRSGIETLDGELLRLVGRAVPKGEYRAMLLDLTPALIRPGEPEDYFVKEQVELWGIDSFWNLPHYPRTEYYRSDSLPLGDGRQLFEFVVPMMPSSWLDSATVMRYEERLTGGEHPTALALSALDVKQPADWEGAPPVTEHWCLTHYVLDGHHKMLAASRVERPLRLLSMLATGEGVSSAEDIERIRDALASPAV